jgi:hypothetical protein
MGDWIVAAATLPVSYVLILLLLGTAPILTGVSYVCSLFFVVAIYALAGTARALGAVGAALYAPVVIVAILGLSYLARDVFGWDSDAVFPILIVLLALQIMLLAAMAGPIEWRVVGWELGLLAVVAIPGFVVRLSDGYTDDAREKWLCAPGSFPQAHAMWHLLSAAALLIGYDLIARFQLAGAPKADRPVVLRQTSALLE